MNNFTFTQESCKEETTSTWLAAIMQFGLNTNVFSPLETFKLKIKKVIYSVYKKLITSMMFIVTGCEKTKDINEKLSGEKLALSMFGMETAPDQSQISELIRLFDSDGIN